MQKKTHLKILTSIFLNRDMHTISTSTDKDKSLGFP